MKRFCNWLILLLALSLAVWATFGNVAYPSVNDEADDEFSACRVKEDLEVISRKPHSVEHPENRLELRDYLVRRLESLGGEVQVLAYDSIPDRIVGRVNVYNIYAKFPPADTTDAVYALFMAHYDSRFAQDVLGKTVYSYGAADDGYGVGVSLEMVREALGYRNQWKQGLIVLFTDVEETDLTGSRLAMERHRSLFDDVSLVFNLEARGVRGPALLFETSAGNRNLMKLYGKADYPSTYSLTSFVYSILPNFTDFTNFRGDFPGYNFSVIDDVKHYHTDKDAFRYVSERSLQHYGAQLSPMLKAYLTEETYSDIDYFRSDSDRIFFTVPFAGLLNFSRPLWLILNLAALLLLLVNLWLFWKYLRLDFGKVGKEMLRIFLYILAVTGIGLAISYLSALFTGQDFKFADLRYVEYDYVILLVYLFIAAAVYMLLHCRHRGDKEAAVAVGILTALLAAAVYFICDGDNGFVQYPLMIYLLSLILYGRFRKGIFPIIGLAGICIFAVSFIYILYTAMTIGALAAVMFLSMVYFSMIYSLWRLLFVSER